MGLDIAVRTRDEMQVVYKEMTRDGAKSNLAKWNLIGEIKFVISRQGQGSKRKRNVHIPKICTPPPLLPPSSSFSDGNFVSKY